MELNAPTKAYHKYIGSRPWLEAPLMGGLGAAAGYMGSEYITPKIVNALMIGRPEQEKADAMRELEADKTTKLISMYMAAMGGMGGAGYFLLKNLDVSGNWGDLGKSFVRGDKHWDDPEVKARMDKVQKKRKEDVQYRGTPSQYHSGRTFKGASYGMQEMDRSRVAVADAINLINDDPFLTLPQKDMADMVIEGSGGSSGLVSGKDLMRSAIQLGAGAATGWAFGRATSALLSLPAPVTRRLSNVGAIAGSIINTGIFSEILK